MTDTTDTTDTTDYWEGRYSTGRTSGDGSRGEAVERKAAWINDLIRIENVRSVVDWGSGDTFLLERLAVPDYLGVDVSPTAVSMGLLRFGHRQWLRWDPLSAVTVAVSAELALSIDVIFHLTDDATYEQYMRSLFGSATRLVLVWSPSKDPDLDDAPHVRHRRWLDDVPDGWVLHEAPGDGVGPWLFCR